MKKKALIAQTLDQLLRSRPLDKITVTELVEVCGISRQTFYYHFRDIMDVVEWQLRQGTDQAVAAGLSSPTPSLQSAFRAMVQMSWEHREAIQQMRSSQHLGEIERLLAQVSRDCLIKLLRAKKSDISTSPEELEFLLSFASYGIAGVLLSIATEKAPNLDELARRIDQAFLRLL